MAVVSDFPQMSGEGEGRARGEQTERRIHDQFIEWVSSHEEQVHEILCHSREFRKEPFCGEVNVGRGEDSFLWRGAAP